MEQAMNALLWRVPQWRDAGHGWCTSCGAPLGQVDGRLHCPNKACPTNLPPGDIGWREVSAIVIDQLKRAAALLELVAEHARCSDGQ
jgi:hypothetical protein